MIADGEVPFDFCLAVRIHFDRCRLDRFSGTVCQADIHSRAFERMGYSKRRAQFRSLERRIEYGVDPVAGDFGCIGMDVNRLCS